MIRSISLVISAVLAAPSTLTDLIDFPVKNTTHSSHEYTGYVKVDPKDYVVETRRSVGDATREPVDMVGVDVTTLATYEYESKLLRWYVTLDKKFRYRDLPHTKQGVYAPGPVKARITKKDLCAREWAKDDICQCTGKVYFGTWSSIMLEKEQKLAVRKGGSVPCSVKSFGGTDPVPGVKKECYCEHK